MAGPNPVTYKVEVLRLLIVLIQEKETKRSNRRAREELQKVKSPTNFKKHSLCKTNCKLDWNVG
jgi:hypothetical protein